MYHNLLLRYVVGVWFSCCSIAYLCYPYVRSPEPREGNIVGVLRPMQKLCVSVFRQLLDLDLCDDGVCINFDLLRFR